MTQTWEGLHPLVVHFPIALLLTAPVFIVCALLVARQARWFLVSALILMMLGTGGLYVGVSTGEAAFVEAETPGPAADEVLDEHQKWGRMLRPVFTTLTILLIITTGLWPRIVRWQRIAGPLFLLLFLLAHGAGAYMLVHTAQLGGRLVHEYGVYSVPRTSSGAE